MLTIFSTPKPFKGHISIIQQNAIRSWTLIQPDCDIIQFGDEEGKAEIATEFNLRHVQDIKRNEYGTPLVNDLFAKAQNLAKHNILCYVNCDIIFTNNLLDTITRVQNQFQKFLIIGQRWDVDVTELIDFKQPNWEQKLLKYTIHSGNLHPPTGIDYFIFPRGTLGTLLPFAIGRPVWDNWLIFKARMLDIPVIDATRSITAIHQNHDYSHIPSGIGKAWEGPEAEYNRKLLSGMDHIFDILDATHIITPRALSLALRPKYLLRKLENNPILKPVIRPTINLINTAIQRIISFHSRLIL